MNNFYLVKITKPEFAHSLLSGSIYMQSLQYFRVQWENYNKAQVDITEGTIGVIGGTSLENHIDNLIAIGHSEAASYLENLNDDEKNMLVGNPIALVESSDFLDKIFCLYTFYFDDISREYQIPSNRLIEFAEEGAELSAVIIHNPSEFLKRMRLAISEIGHYSCDKVRYLDFYKTQEINLFGRFFKDSEYSWQQEFRVACRDHTPPSKPQGDYDIWIPAPLTLNIGDIADIAVVIPDIGSFFDSTQFSKIMAEINMEIKDYTPIEKQLCVFEQDIAYCLHIESLLSKDLYLLIESDAFEHYKEAANYMFKADYAKAKAKLMEYKMAVQQEPIATNSIPIERALMDIYLRIAENFLGLEDKENLSFYYIRLLCFYHRLKAKGINVSDDKKFVKRADEFLRDFDNIKHFNESIPAAFAALENETFKTRT